jgi:hypothetical protein
MAREWVRENGAALVVCRAQCMPALILRAAQEAAGEVPYFALHVRLRTFNSRQGVKKQ